MMYKWLGAALIVGGCGGFGVCLAGSYCREERRLGQLLCALRYMYSQLQYQLSPLPELCRQAGLEAGGAVGSVLLQLSRELESCQYPDAASCMRTAMQQRTDLSARSRRLLNQLGRELGRFDLAGQLQGIQAVKAACREQRQLLSQDRQLRLRSYRTLSLCAGTALAILFL